MAGGLRNQKMNKKYHITNSHRSNLVSLWVCEATASLMKATETDYKSNVKSTQTIDAVCCLKGMPLLS